ncbi:ABC transporter substrate-binding protein [Solimicrobium silvestre]|uniref:Bacterial extracellular solute-binding protein, family 3 n=1 Tax=Solimicrobium silvestre TaxID=2099400 RepID=A0A2S9H2Q2_9BURK|nr:ABC transporter substrate-binding protein [Solimicrobium silvestre]PRC94248.1 hypothetical protein S2091_0869 [Solimicrobium silvestre]
MKHNSIFKIIAALSVNCLLSVSVTHAQSVLHIASDDWCPYICAQNGHLTSGYLVDVATQAMLISGYQVESALIPLTRAMHEASTGSIQGVYAPPIDDRLRLSIPIAYSRACFYTLAEQTWRYQGIASLHNVVVGIVGEYGYDDNLMDAYVIKNQHKHLLIDTSFGENAGLSNLKKLLAARFPVMLEHEAVMTMLAKNLGAEYKIRQAGCLEHALPLPIGFTKMDSHNEDWIRALTLGIQQLEASGKLAELRQHYHIPEINTK